LDPTVVKSQYIEMLKIFFLFFEKRNLASKQAFNQIVLFVLLHCLNNSL